MTPHRIRLWTYTGRDEQGHLYTSEMKALVPVCRTVAEFPPGCYLDSAQGDAPRRYYERDWQHFEGIDRAAIGIRAMGIKMVLPRAILERQKEQFSDGVGYAWINSLKDNAAGRVSDRDMDKARFRFPHNTPDSREAYLYRSIFEDHFPLPSAAQCVPGGPSVACSTPEALEWDATLRDINDPFGRAVRDVHRDAY